MESKQKDSYYLKNLIKNYNISPEEFLEIIFNGFYYIYQDEIYWEPNAVFVGNEVSGHMIGTYPLGMDIHAFDWGRKEHIFNFKDYDKTWSIHRKALENNLNR